MARAVREGVASKIGRGYLNPANTIVVDEQDFAFGSYDHLPRSRFLVTYDVITCLTVLAYNPKYRAGFIGHAYEVVNVSDAIERAVDLLDAKTVVLFGGRAYDNPSLDNVSIAEAMLSRYQGRVKVTGRDTLRMKRPTAIGMDTKTGELIYPTNKVEYTRGNSYPLRAWLDTPIANLV